MHDFWVVYVVRGGEGVGEKGEESSRRRSWQALLGAVPVCFLAGPGHGKELTVCVWFI